MKYFFIDASDLTTFAQIGNNDKIYNIKVNTNRNLGAQITRISDELFTKAGLNKNEIDVYAVGLGPGSLTGLRVAGSFLRCCAFITGKSLIGIGLFDWAAFSLKEAGITDKVRLITPALINKAFYSDIDIKRFSAGNKVDIKFGDFKDSLIESGLNYGIYCNKYLDSVKNVNLLPFALHKLINELYAVKGNNEFDFEKLLKTLPLYVIPSQAERNFTEKQC